MGRLLKWVAGIIGLLLVVIVAAAVILPLVIDPNEHKDTIEQLVKDRTGRDLKITDRLELSVFPSLGVTTGGVSLSNAPGFGDEPFARIDKLDLRVKLLPLLSRRLEVDALLLKGLTLNLAKDKQGRTNWEDLSQGTEKKAAEPVTREEGAGLGFNLSGVQIEQAKLVWDDRQKGEKYVLRDVSLTSGALAPGATVPLAMGFTLDSDKPKMSLHFKLTSTLVIGSDLKTFELPDLKAKLAATGEGLPEKGLDLSLTTALALDQNQDTLSLDGMKLQGSGIAIDGRLAGSKLSGTPLFQGELLLQKTDPSAVLALFGEAPHTQDPAVLKRLSGKVGLHASGDNIALKPLSLTLDDSKLTGEVTLRGPAIRFALQLDKIDLDRYLPPPSGQTKQKSTEKPAAEDPLAGLRGLDLSGRFSIGSLKLNNLRMSSVEVKVNAKNGVLKIDPASADLYQGKLLSKVTVDARKPKPRIHAVKDLTGIQIGPLLKDLSDTDRLSGTGELHADLTMVGLSEAKIRQSLNGRVSFEFHDGAVKGINIAKAIRTVKTKLAGAGTVADDKTEQTDFSIISGSAVITDGLIRNDDLQAKSPLLRVSGKGEVNLPADTIDYVVTTTLVKSLQGQGAKDDQLSGVPIPVRLHGSLAKPSYSIDLKSILETKVRQKAEEKLMEKIEQKTGGKLGDRLKGLLR